jgi:hypothetical protein
VSRNARDAVLKRFFLFYLCPIWILWAAAPRVSEPSFSLQSSVFRSRIVVAEEPGATQAFKAQPAEVRRLVDRAIQHHTGKQSAASAWGSLVSTQDTVGIKVFSNPGPESGTRPAVVAAVIEGLLAAGVPAQQIIVWDKQLSDLRRAGFMELGRRYQVRVASSASAGYDESAFYESSLIGNLVWGDLEFARDGDEVGRKSFVSRLITRDITKLISITPLLNHNLAGTTGNLLNLTLGSVDNTMRFERHADRLAVAIPELYALPELGDRVVLNITDALLCQYAGEQRSLLHYSTMLNQVWVSADPVALDVLAIRELERQRQTAQHRPRQPSIEVYKNAMLLELGISDLRAVRIERAP